MITRKNTVIAFIGTLIVAWLAVFLIQVEAQTADEQKQALIGEWRGDWRTPAGALVSMTLIIHEIDTGKAKARCTYTDASWGEKKYPVLADFTPGPNPKLEFKVEGNEFNFVLKKSILKGASKGFRSGMITTLSGEMKKYPKK